jgi:hypothetical protein
VPGSRLKNVAHWKFEVSDFPVVRESVGVYGARVDEIVDRQVKLVTVLHPTPPSVEMGTRDDPVRNPTVVKSEDGVVVGYQAALTTALLKICGLVANSIVVFEESMIGSPVPLYESRTDKNLSGRHRIDAAIGDATVSP